MCNIKCNINIILNHVYEWYELINIYILLFILFQTSCELIFYKNIIDSLRFKVNPRLPILGKMKYVYMNV